MAQGVLVRNAGQETFTFPSPFRGVLAPGEGTIFVGTVESVAAALFGSAVLPKPGTIVLSALSVSSGDDDTFRKNGWPDAPGPGTATPNPVPLTIASRDNNADSGFRQIHLTDKVDFTGATSFIAPVNQSVAATAGKAMSVRGGKGLGAAGGNCVIGGGDGGTPGTHFAGKLQFQLGALVVGDSGIAEWLADSTLLMARQYLDTFNSIVDSGAGYRASMSSVWVASSPALALTTTNIIVLESLGCTVIIDTNGFGVFNHARSLQRQLTNNTGAASALQLVDVTTAGLADPAKVNANFASIYAALEAYGWVKP